MFFLGVCSGWCVRFVGLFLWCAGVWVVFLVSLRGVSLHVSLVCGVGWLGGCVLGLWLWCTCFLFLEVFDGFCAWCFAWW